MNELARRAVACKGWRWLSGMRATDEHGGIGRVIVWRPGVGMVVCLGGDGKPVFTPTHSSDPDLTDPATLGCLLQLVREAWDDPTATVFPDRRDRDEHGKPKTRWFRMIDSAHHGELVAWHCPADTEVEALVMALEAAP